jgi:hypothetical protein
MRKARKSRVRVRACQALTTYTRLQRCFSYIQDTLDWTKWTYKLVSQRQIAILLAAGDVQPVTRQVDGKVEIVGYRAMRPIRRSDVSPACLNAATMNVAAMGSHDSMSRGEAAQLARYRLWPFTGDSRARLTGPRPTETETAYLGSIRSAR